jgi:argininosuccinate lyase
VAFDAERGLEALDSGFTQATDLAEALVRRGVAFREAYKAVGQLVALAVSERVALRAIDPTRARAIHPELDAESLRTLEPRSAVTAKESFGGTGPRSVDTQIAWLRERASILRDASTLHGTLDTVAARIFAEPLEPS